jgi:hypothetical protein
LNNVFSINKKKMSDAHVLSNQAASQDPTNVLKNQCVSTLYEFLDASAEVWPECPALKKYLEIFKEARQTNSEIFTAAVYSAISEQASLFERLQTKDITVFQEPLEIFQELAVYAKMSEAPQDVQDTCWTYILQIIQTASLSSVYSSAPTEMLQKVSAVADTFMKQMEEGTFDMKELDPMKLTQMMMEGVDKKEMEKWASSVMNPQSINSLMGVMQNVMGNMGGEGEDETGIDFASMAAGMAGLQGGGGANSMEGAASALGALNPEMIQKMMGGFMKNLKKK